ncbi:hypothetical protein GGS23DRAFT_185212 [Durotheca rogersii]|uniref:uncharacterized protein n=1 Tax=Durotheca rogersii TaxID=419775 RepID=UPI00221E9A6F|nr:uncharacterized protein GGS23DRAFT_185212 [Durotheca rogersii]KAI5867597.1 hypothetical protein GGS23DRAFT_185212 [Durotheca rogersii]
MGNSPSAEASRRGRRTTQKLSKPRTGNPTAAGLLSSSGLAASARRISGLPAPSPATSSPKFLETDPAIGANPLDSKKEPQSRPQSRARSLRRIFRSNTSKEARGRQQRCDNTVVSEPQHGRWSSRASSLRDGPEVTYNYGQAHTQGSSSANASRTSVNYDLSSYEARRLLNSVEAPSRRNSLMVSEGQWQVPETTYSDFRSRHLSIGEAAPPISRANSETSLYTPMRRRSLLTPGIATRDTRPDPSPQMPEIRYSVSSTPARRDSTDAASKGMPSFLPMMHSDPVPRALTPCEAEYRQTGAFKHGTLRITNGSPTRSPARGSDNDDRRTRLEDLTPGKASDSYSGVKHLAARSRSEIKPSGTTVEKVEVQNSGHCQSSDALPLPRQGYRGQFTDVIAASSSVLSGAPSPRLPEHHPTGALHNDWRPEPAQVQVASKRTAVDDNLFDIEQDEYSSVEVLDVRIDHNAKSQPPRRKPVSEGGGPTEITRSDSGVASSTSELSQVPLSKADSGYSSSVSLRSFSLRPPVPEKDHPSFSEEVVAIEAIKQNVGIRDLNPESPAVTAPNAAVPRPFDRTSPPPVPKKDPHLTALAPSTATHETPSLRQDYRACKPEVSSYHQAPERTLSAVSTRGQVNGDVEPRQASPRNLHPSHSLSAVGSGYRKPRRFQRLLGGAPLSIVVPKPEFTKDGDVTTLSQNMQVKVVKGHAERLSISYRRLALKSAASKETLGTILSVGSAEMLQDEDMLGAPKGVVDQLVVADRSQAGLIPSVESAIAQGGSGSFMKTITRKPVPARSRAPSVEGESAEQPKPLEQNPSESFTMRGPSPQNASYAGNAPNNPVGSEGRTRYSVPARLTGPAYAPAYTERGVESTYPFTGHTSEWLPTKSQSMAPLELPSSAFDMRLPRSPPPVSMKTRNIGPLRVPSPLRAHSTPPETLRLDWPSVSRRESREGGLVGVEDGDRPSMAHPTISRRSSRESYHDYAPDRAHYVDAPSYALPQNKPQRRSLGADFRESRAPNWDVQTDHDTSLCRRLSSNYSRRSSLASQTSQRSSVTTGLNLPRQQRSYGTHSSVSRRASFDGYDLLSHDSYIRDNGPYPSMSRNGHVYVTDPWSGRPMPQPWDPSLQYPPPYVPRTHHRHQSLDQHGNHVRYRILHSYNSPAYRNAPIWG